MFKEYGELSTKLYQLKYPPGHSLGGDMLYYTQQLAGMPGPVLEAGVGTGRMLVPLLRQGLDVDGVDLSPDMLKQCKANLSQNRLQTNLYNQDLTKLKLPRKYGAIIMPTGSFCLLPRDVVKAALVGFYNHLLPGGKFVFDAIFPDDFKKGETFCKTYPLEDGAGILYTNFSDEIDWVEQKTSHVIRYELVKDGEVQKAELSGFTLYWYGMWELEMLLENAGFVDIKSEFGYGKDEDKSVLTFFATKGTDT